uniref:Keratin, type I cytoskeletal 20 n=1 Tax=Sander lucioperca TaxID=283035 RepID=A0A8C9YEJ7_SANLU
IYKRKIVSYSAHSISSGSAISLSKGVQLVGGGKTLISTGALQRRAPSVYGGAGGYGTRISQSAFSSSGSLTPYGETAVINNEKVTMQNLNDRLSSYLDKVRSLESANRKLELQIREFYEKKAPSVSSDFTNYFATITELRAQIDNAQLAVELLNTQITTCTTEVKTFYTQLSELKRTLQTLEISRQSILTEVGHKWTDRMQEHTFTVQCYLIVLIIQYKVDSHSVVVYIHKPHIERRVKTIVEEIVDGKVVSSSVDTQVEDIQ